MGETEKLVKAPENGQHMEPAGETVELVYRSQG